MRAIAADGAPIDEVSDGRYADLPFVVGEGANERVREFVALLDAMDELKPRVEAGVLIDQRRWNLRLKSGVDVKLPETDPEAAIADASTPPAPVPHPGARRAGARFPGSGPGVRASVARRRPPPGRTSHAAKKGAQP